MSSCLCGKNPNQSGGRGRASASGRGSLPTGRGASPSGRGASPSGRGASPSGRDASPSGRGGDNFMDGKSKGQTSGCHPCGKKRCGYDGLGDGRGGTGTGMGNTGRGTSATWQDISGSGEGKANENNQQYPCPATCRSGVYGGSSQGRSGPRQMFMDSPDINTISGSKMGASGRISCPGSFGGSCNKSSCLGCKKGSSDGRSYMTGDRKSHGPSDLHSYRSGNQHSGGKGDGSDLTDRNNAGNPLSFEMNDASWGLCKAAAIFLAGVYLTTRMHNVANLIG